MAQLTYATGLRCRICGEGYPLEALNACERCFGPLEVAYDYAAIRAGVTRETIAAGPRTIWRYRALLPIASARPVDLGVGGTPLIRAERLGRALGLDELYLKNDCVNPTYSFKDRVVAVAASRAVELGLDTFACASTGNLAAAVAAAAAWANLRCYVFVPADLELSKVINALVYGPHLVQVDGNYDQVNRLCSELADEYGWGFANVNLRPYYAEGSKTLAFEVAEALGWSAPDHIVAPIASGALLVKIDKGFRELEQVGLIPEQHIRFSGAQALGCAPVATAFASGSDQIQPVKPRTIARSLAIGDPADGPFALELARTTGGAIDAASDEEIVAGMLLLARTEGIFAETAGGTTIAVLKRLAERGVIRRDERVVAYITGNGLKTPDAVAGVLQQPYQVAPSVASFEERVLSTERALAGVR
ncbi:MAG TPA: threonine synthase [Chloroflexota bacterium]|jgi:threonine synthase|nr:threonine synthase [Chloroflexota bacterium]